MSSTALAAIGALSCWKRAIARRRALRAAADDVAHAGEHPVGAIWLASPGDAAAPLTAGTAKDHAPRWSPDGRTLYFLSDREKRGVSQSYRISRKPSIFPEGTGLTDRLSDIVGRTRIRYGRFLDVTHRYRVDKDSFAFRRNEVDLTIGSALDIFGGVVPFESVVAWQQNNR